MRQYTEQLYLPAANAYQERSANKGAVGGELVNWRHNLQQKWGTIHFGQVKVDTRDGQHVFEVQIYISDDA